MESLRSRYCSIFGKIPSSRILRPWIATGVTQFDLFTFLRACLYDMEDTELQVQLSHEKLVEGEITKFEDLMMLSISDLSELGLEQRIAERLGMLIHLFKGS